MAVPIPPDETARLKALREYRVLDTSPEEAFDDIVRLASYICKTPISYISLVDEGRQWFKAKVGVTVDETPREQAFCAHAIANPHEMLIVEDATKDERFADNPLVTQSPGIRFYAGVPLITPNGQAVGTLCVADHQPRRLTHEQRDVLSALARQVVAQLEMRRSLVSLERTVEVREHYVARLQEYQRSMEVMQSRLASQSETDELTGLKNRRALDRLLVEQFHHAVNATKPLAIAVIDVDQFKSYNDSYGHLAGDEALIAVAEALRRSARSHDVLARVGGEEFVALFPGTSREGALVVAERMRRAVQRTPWPHCPLTISIGVTAFDVGVEVETPKDLIARADAALYRAKAAGRNRVLPSD